MIEGDIAEIPGPYDHPALSPLNIPANRLGPVFRLPISHAAEDLGAVVRTALDNPIGTAPLHEIARNARQVAILVDDATRPTPAHVILPFIVEELERAGVEDHQITIVFAVGSHRETTEAEAIAKIGEAAFRRYRTLSSRFWDPEHLVLLGHSEEGVPILIEEVVAEADVKIGIGGILPHAAAGWSGGGKIIYPGVAGKETVMHFHFSHGLTETNMTGREECSVRTNMENWVEVVGLDFIVNCVLTASHQVHSVVAGHYIAAHRTGVAQARPLCTCVVPRRFDVVVSYSAPHDIDLWQGTKAIYSSESIVADGGTLLMVGSCPEGLGNHPTFPERIGRDDNSDQMRAILRREQEAPEDPLPLPPGAMLARLRQRIRCAVVSPGLTRETVEQARYEWFRDCDSAIQALTERYPDSDIAVVTNSDIVFEHGAV